MEATRTAPTAADLASIGTVGEFGLVTALDVLGRLVDGPEGFLVWEIVDELGVVVHEDVASDRDAEWLAKQVWLQSEGSK